MGCSSSKSQTNAAMRMLEYEHMAASEDQGLKVIPTQLDNEEWRDGLIRHVTCIPPLIFITLEIFYKFKEIDETKQNKRTEGIHCFFSARSFFNIFHAGFSSAYIQNLKYLLLLDFRSVEDWIVERVTTSHHYNKFPPSDKSKKIH